MDDLVVKEIKVFVSSQLTQYLHLVLAPTRASLTGSDAHGALKGRFKKTSKMFELDVPLNTRHQTYSKERGQDLASAASSGSIKVVGSHVGQGNSELINKVTLSGGQVPKINATYFVGVIREDGLHLTPVKSVLCMRPVLTYLDEIDAKNKASTKKISDMDKPVQADVTKAIQVQFRKKETEEQVAARLNSYAYLKRQIDEEAWTRLSHFPRESEEAVKVANRLFCESQEPLEFTPQSPQDYLQQLFTA